MGPSEGASRQRTAEFLLSLHADATVANLPQVLRELRALMEHRGPAFNRSRAACFAFVRDRFPEHATLRQRLEAVPAFAEPRVRARHPCTVPEARKIASALGENWGPCWWTMCVTGMGPKEYWTDGYTITSDGVEIRGAKDTRQRGTTARQRIVPLLDRITPPVGTPSGFAQALRRAEFGVGPYDARRSFARWLDDAGLPGYLQDALMGHGPKGMRELYKWGEIRAMLGEAREALLKVIGAVPHLSRTQEGGMA